MHAWEVEMVYSMTGAGEGRVTENGFDLHVYIKSVNHRFLNIQIRMPRGYHKFEPLVREIVSAHTVRGKIDVTVDFYSVPDGTGDFVVNHGYGIKLAGMIKKLAEELDIPDGLNAEKLVRYPEMITAIPADDDYKDSVKSVLVRACKQALEAFLVSRRTEGKQMVDDINRRIGSLRKMMQSITNYAEKQPDMVRQKLEMALLKLQTNSTVDVDRLKDEIMLWAVRSDITEEVVRFNCHLDRMTVLADLEGSAGKELEFLLQELHREITTTGSKSVVTEINQLVVPIKMEIEKMREQAQNLE
jgi:uncharacterized protein (TIGR00255 family)